jgi:hypothetical protein
MSRPKTNRGTDRAARAVAGCLAAIGLGGWLAGCSDIYLDRRETIALGGGDAVAANEATQMVDPWPRESGNKNIAFNGQKMQVAVERYRTGRVIPPIASTTSVIEAPPADAASAAPLSPSPPQNAALGPGSPAASTAVAQ